MLVARKGEAAMKVAITGLFAATLTLMTGAANAASIVDTVIASARPHLVDCPFKRIGAACGNHWTSPKRRYEPASARATVLNESSSVSNTRSPVGRWIVDDDDRRVEIMPCGKSLCGVIAAAKPNAVDRLNPDPAQRNRNIVNLPVLIEMTKTEKNRWEGQIYNTRDGRTYSGKISLRGTNLLEVEGNAPHALLMQTWVKDTKDDE
jgi:uncharacterized protein (DUF2147 family)